MPMWFDGYGKNKAFVLLIVSGFFFSLMELLVKLTPRIPLWEVVFFRSLVTFILVLSVLLKNKVPVWGLNKLALFLRGITGTIALVIFYGSIKNMPLASAITIQYLGPVFTILLATFILNERTHWLQCLGFLVCFAGVILVKGFDPRISTFWFVLAIISSLFNGFAYNFIRLAGRTDNHLVIMFYLPLISLPVSGVFTIFEWVTPNITELIYLLFAGVFTHLAQLTMTIAYKSDEFSQLAYIRYFGLVYALAYGYFIFGEHQTAIVFLGMILVVSGIIFNLFIGKKLRNS